MSNSAAHANALVDAASLETARFICHRGKQRVAALFREARDFSDSDAYQLAQRLLENARTE